MSFETLYTLANSLAQNIEANQKLAIPLLTNKLKRCLANDPYDQTVGMVSRVLNEMSEKNLFIRRADFQNLYQKFHTHNTKFAEYFEEELGQAAPEPQITTYQRDANENHTPYQAEDQVLVNALESVFDRSIPLKMYSQAAAQKALKSVGNSLDTWNLNATKLSVSDGNERFIVIQADYETPKGITSFYVPVEVKQNEVSEPEVFLGNMGPQDLNHLNIKSYLTKNTGHKLSMSGTTLVSLLTEAASQNREVSDAELAATRLMANRQSQFNSEQNQILGVKMAEEYHPDVQLPRYHQFDSFEKQFTSPEGHSTWQFGKNVAIARDYLVRELRSFGYANPQVVVANSDDKTVFYGVSLDSGNTAFTVPVKMSSDSIQYSTVLLCNGMLASFDREGIEELVATQRTDNKVAAVASSFASLKPSEVLNSLRTAIVESNYTRAEDALNVLANSDDPKAHAIGFQMYFNALAGNIKSETKCSKLMKSANSEHPICSHTGLPAHKVYQDKDGFCRPLYRQGMDETYEGASFMNAKIFG